VYVLFLDLLGWGIFYLAPIISNEANSHVKQFSTLKKETEFLIFDLEQMPGVRLPLDSFVEEVEVNLGKMLERDQIFRLLRAASTDLV